MKKITVTTTLAGFNGTETTASTAYDYVSDGYTEDDYKLEGALEWGQRSLDTEGVNYTKTMRDAYRTVDALGNELEWTWSELETYSTMIASDATLSEKDRESLTSALDNAIKGLYGLSEERYDALTALEEALDAFKNLTLSE